VESTTFEQSAAKVRAETTVRGLLATTCEELVALLDATACAVSRVVGDLLVGLDEHTLSGRPLEHGHEYLIPDYPLTQEVVESGEPRQVSRLDPDADQTEADLLAKLGFESLLMVCLPSGGACWGLVEVYTEKGRFADGQPEVVQRLARLVGKRLEQLERP
jgi:transcriptional regulator with GAF, ATPase, and Fis domain